MTYIIWQKFDVYWNLHTTATHPSSHLSLPGSLLIHSVAIFKPN